MDSQQSPLLLMPSPPQPLDIHIKIPRSDDNLFERLIRDPQALHRPMREMQCAEMLRAVLVACPTLKSGILKWLAPLVGVPTTVIDDLEWVLETEQSIGSKRDDLRIEGWRNTPDGQQRVVLWTIEIKVAAFFHDSSLQEWDDDEAQVSADDPEMVNQLVNYDNWLTKEKNAEYRSGFVLALHDLTSSIPSELTQTWHCLTWTHIALQTESMLVAELLPPTEHSFAQHMLGFIRQRLWDTTDMSNSKLELDDVALLRAISAIGQSCSRKVRDLVNQFENEFRDIGVDFMDIKTSNPRFFHRADGIEYEVRARCIDSEIGEVVISAKVVVDQVKVTIFTYPKGCVANQRSQEVVNQYKDQLLSRHSDWVFFESHDSPYVIAEIAKPLISVLAEVEWQAPLIEFVRGSIQDLTATGILDALLNIQSETT